MEKWAGGENEMEGGILKSETTSDVEKGMIWAGRQISTCPGGHESSTMSNRCSDAIVQFIGRFP